MKHNANDICFCIFDWGETFLHEIQPVVIHIDIFDLRWDIIYCPTIPCIVVEMHTIYKIDRILRFAPQAHLSYVYLSYAFAWHIHHLANE